MKRNFDVLASTLLTLGFVAFACTSGEVVDGPLTGSAGAGNPTGTAGTGPGNAGTMGQAGRGGTTGQAGSVQNRGGTTGQAGSNRGGTTGAGAMGVAGTTGAGAMGVAGTTGAGATGVAGTTGSGGSGSSCPPSFAVSTNGFVQMPVSGGCWSGYPYTYADSFGSMVMPAPMASFTTASLKLTGTIVAVSGTMYSYAGIGFSLGQSSTGETPALVTPKGSGLNINFTNSTTGAGVVLRAQVTNGPTTWCKDVTTSGPIAYSDFHITCYGPVGAAYAKEPIKGIELNLAGGTASGSINLTINSVTESP